MGDVEILYVPRFEDRQIDMFTTAPANLVEQAIGILLLGGEPVDLFTATGANWWNYLVCRTDTAQNNVRIFTAARVRGWKWNAYGAGFTRGGPLAGAPELRLMASERVFEFVGLPFAEPEARV